MRVNNRDQNSSPEQVYNYVQGLLKVEEDNDDSGSTVEQALGVCFNYLTQKKIDWGIHLQKLVQLFLDLAFETEKHSKIKQVLKSYRAITQNQHPDSLKSILQYYRDNKLQEILDNQIPEDSIPFIREMKSIQNDEASSEIIISSFTPQIKNKREQIRVNLKIVWEGYKAIIDTVRFNQKLENVYRQTLRKISTFVQKFNRKHEYKSFCEYSRSGLRNVMSKRGDKTEQQKGFYIDIQKQEVNTNNIELRLEQFTLTTKLGLWQEAFQVMEDINDIIRVRKGPLKNLLRCEYFEKLAIIFRKSNYWHYHAYAYFNYYSIYMTKSKVEASDRIKMADKLILSVLCIPPSTIESHQSKESQQKIASMMVSSKKIPQKKQLQEIMISKGVVESASPAIKQLWYFMFLNFDLTSLSKGLKLLEQISKQHEYKQFVELLQDILIYKQLIEIAEVYQRIKYTSLLSIIPLSKQKIQKVLLQCHHRKVIDFVFDEREGIIIFEDRREETNPYEQFLSCYTDVALLLEENRKYDSNFILKKAVDFVDDAKKYYGETLPYKIDEYKKKLKKPKQDLYNRQVELKKKQNQDKLHEQNLKKLMENEERQAEQQRKKLFIDKKIKIDEIIKLKQKRIIKIGNKRVQQLTDDEINEMNIQIFEQGLKDTITRVTNDNENRNKKRFNKVDFAERERRFEINQIIKATLQGAEKQKQKFQASKLISKADYEQKQKLKKQIEKVGPEVKAKIESHYNINKEKFENDMRLFKENLTLEFKKKILQKAREMHKEEQRKRKQDEERRRTDQLTSGDSGMWSFKGGVKGSQSAPSAPGGDDGSWKRKTKDPSAPVSEAEKNIALESNLNYKREPVKGVNDGNWGRKAANTSWQTSKVFSEMNVDEEEKKEKKDEGGWLGRARVQTEQPQKTQQKQVKVEQKAPQKFVAPIIQQPKGAWNRGPSKPVVDVNANVNINQVKKEQGPRRQQPQLVMKGAAKKDDKKQITKGKGW